MSNIRCTNANAAVMPHPLPLPTQNLKCMRRTQTRPENAEVARCLALRCSTTSRMQSIVGKRERSLASFVSVARLSLERCLLQKGPASLSSHGCLDDCFSIRVCNGSVYRQQAGSGMLARGTCIVTYVRSLPTGM